MGKRSFFLAVSALFAFPLLGAAQGPFPPGALPVPPGYHDPAAYFGSVPGYHENGLGWSLGYYNIYDSRPYPFGWYWPNVSWPSRDYHYTYRPLVDTYRVFYPSLTFPRGNSYLITPLPRSYADAQGGNAAARVDVSVPAADAEVWIEDTKMTQTGLTRTYSTPALAPGSDFNYDIAAQWLENGKPKKETQTVTVRSGETTRVTFPKGR